MFRRYRPYNPGEFIVVGVDTSWGGTDYCVAQFLSKTHLDVPAVYHSKVLATEMTPLIHAELERIYDETKVKPVVAFERNNGGVAEIERLATLNRNGKYTIYTEKRGVGTSETTEETIKLGWTTSSSTRPTMLSMLKEVVDNQLIRIYDKPTITEMFSFIVSQTSSSWKAQAEVGAHDDCFVAGTMVTTDRGQVPIELLQVGDMALTRKGYRPIIHTRSKYKSVISKYGLTGTKDHPFITAYGNVCFDKLSASDIIYIWNEKQSTITGKTITGTLTRIGGSLEFTSGDTTSGKKHQWRSIGRFGLTLMGKYRKGCTSTIKTRIPLTTILTTLNLSQAQNTRSITWDMSRGDSYIEILGNNRLKESLAILSGGDRKTQKKLEKFIGGMDYCRRIELRDSSKSGARLMLIKSDKSIKPTDKRKLNDLSRLLKNGELLTQVKYQSKQEKTLWLVYTERPKRKFVSFAGKSLHTLVNSVLSTALKIVGLKHAAKQKVYNIQVADTPEYFVNGVLVHNCIMALAIAWQLYQTENPPMRKVHKRPEIRKRRLHV